MVARLTGDELPAERGQGGEGGRTAYKNVLQFIVQYECTRLPPKLAPSLVAN